MQIFCWIIVIIFPCQKRPFLIFLFSSDERRHKPVQEICSKIEKYFLDGLEIKINPIEYAKSLMKGWTDPPWYLIGHSFVFRVLLILMTLQDRHERDIKVEKSYSDVLKWITKEFVKIYM